MPESETIKLDRMKASGARFDGRRLAPDELRRAREEVVRLFTEGLPVMQIVSATGLGWPTVHKALELFQRGGLEALRPKPRGRKAGSGTHMEPSTQLGVCESMRRLPSQLGLDGHRGLWTPVALKALLLARFNVELSTRTLRNYRERWGLVASSKRASATPEATLTNGDDRASEGARVFWLQAPKRLPDFPWTTLEANGEAGDEVGGGGGRRDEDAARSMKTRGASKHRYRFAAAVDNVGSLAWYVFDGQFNAKRQAALLKGLARMANGRRLVAVRYDDKAFLADELASLVDLSRIDLRSKSLNKPSGLAPSHPSSST